MSETKDIRESYDVFIGKTITERKSKKDYEIYHKSYTSAVDEVKRFITVNGYTIDEEVWWSDISTGPGKPSEGKTVQHNMPLLKDGKETRRRVHVQVFGMPKNYELNMYLS